MLPQNAKCSMTSLAATKNIYSWKDWWRIEFCSWLRPRQVSRLRARFARDEIIKSLRSRRRALLWITLHVNVTLWLMRILEVSKCVEIYYTERLNNDWGSRGLSHCHTMWHNARYQTRRWARNACIFWYFISLMKFKADCSFLLGDTLAPNCMAAQCLVF